MWLDRLTVYCLQYNIISEDDVPWFQYGIEKRVSTIVVGLPVFILAVILSNIYTAISFYVSFYLLRSRTNGYHAKSILGCLLASILCVFVCMSIVYPLLSIKLTLSISAICLVIIWAVAPFNHPDMNYTSDEYQACKRSSRIRAVLLYLCIILSFYLGLEKIAKGLFIGVAMAVLLLCLAHILNGGKNYENHERKSK